MNVQEFSGKIKAKYPEYADMDDADLATRIVAKYPEYKEHVTFEAPAAPEQGPGLLKHFGAQMISDITGQDQPNQLLPPIGSEQVATTEQAVNTPLAERLNTPGAGTQQWGSFSRGLLQIPRAVGTMAVEKMNQQVLGESDGGKTQPDRPTTLDEVTGWLKQLSVSDLKEGVYKAGEYVVPFGRFAPVYDKYGAVEASKQIAEYAVKDPVGFAAELTFFKQLAIDPLKNMLKKGAAQDAGLKTAMTNTQGIVDDASQALNKPLARVYGEPMVGQPAPMVPGITETPEAQAFIARQRLAMLEGNSGQAPSPAAAQGLAKDLAYQEKASARIAQVEEELATLKKEMGIEPAIVPGKNTIGGDAAALEHIEPPAGDPRIVTAKPVETPLRSFEKKPEVIYDQFGNPISTQRILMPDRPEAPAKPILPSEAPKAPVPIAEPPLPPKVAPEGAQAAEPAIVEPPKNAIAAKRAAVKEAGAQYVPKPAAAPGVAPSESAAAKNFIAKRRAEAAAKAEVVPGELDISYSPNKNYNQKLNTEPWALSQTQYGDISMGLGGITAKGNRGKYSAAIKEHKNIVQQALSEGKPVPPEVLKDYPDLVKKAEPPAPRKSEVQATRMGDWYEIFGDEAKKIAEILGTSATRGKDGVAHVGFPYHSAKESIKKLKKAGYDLKINESLAPVSEPAPLAKTVSERRKPVGDEFPVDGTLEEQAAHANKVIDGLTEQEARSAAVKAGAQPKVLDGGISPYDYLKSEHPEDAMSAIKPVLKESDRNKSQMKLFAGGVAGIEQDENGEIGFNPAKAALGMGAMGIAGKVQARRAAIAEKVAGSTIARDFVNMVKGESGVPKPLQQAFRAGEGRARDAITGSADLGKQMHVNFFKAQDSPALVKMADAAHRGDKAALDRIARFNKPLAEQITRSRAEIDATTDALIGEIKKLYPDGNMPVKWEGNTIPAGKLIEVMEKNKGSYVRREYSINHVDGYKPSEQQWTDAVKGYMKDHAGHTEEQARIFLKRELELHGIGDALPNMSARINKSPFMARENSPVWLRDFMGEIKDPALNHYLTTKALANNVAKMRIFGEIAKNKSIFFDKATKDAVATVGDYVQVSARDDALAWGAIADKYTTPEMAEFLGDVSKLDNVYDATFKSGIAALKKLKTSQNIPTHIRNFLGNIDFAMIGGISPLNPKNHKFYQQGRAALLGKNEALRHELIQEGVIGTELAHAELINTSHDMIGMMNEGKNWTDRLKKGAAAFDRGLTKAYSLEDQYFKAAKYLEARSRGLSKRDAVSEVYKFFPNYAEVSRFAKGVRESGVGSVLMPFFSFKSEAHRIFMNIVRDGSPAEKAKLAAVLGWRSTYNLAALTAKGIPLGAALGYLWKNNQINGSLADPKRPNRRGMTQRGIMPFDNYLPDERTFQGNIISGPIQNVMRAKGAGNKIKGLAKGINATTGAIVSAAVDKDPSKLWDAIIPFREEKYK